MQNGKDGCVTGVNRQAQYIIVFYRITSSQAYDPQNAFHQNLSQMREAARSSILSIPGIGSSTRSTLYGGNNSDDSHAPMMPNALGQPRTSRLRNHVKDDGNSEDDDESLIMQQPVQSLRGDDGRF